MVQILLAWKSHSINAEPDILYAGPSGDARLKAAKAMAGKGYVRAQLLVNPIGVPVQIPETPEEIKARTDAAAKAKAEREASERERQVNEAKRKVEEAQRQLKIAAETPEERAKRLEAEKAAQAKAQAEAAAKAEAEQKAAKADAAKKAKEAAERKAQLKKESLELKPAAK